MHTLESTLYPIVSSLDSGIGNLLLKSLLTPFTLEERRSFGLPLLLLNDLFSDHRS